MRGYELKTVLDSLEYNYKNEWEMNRFQSYIIAQTQSTKHLTPRDIMKFSWDEPTTSEERVTQEDVKRLTEKMNRIVEENKNKMKS